MGRVRIEDIAEIAGQERALDIAAASNVLVRYNVYRMAVDNGIKFGPTDLSMEDLSVFDIVRTKAEEIGSKKSEISHGRQPPKNNIRTPIKR